MFAQARIFRHRRGEGRQQLFAIALDRRQHPARNEVGRVRAASSSSSASAGRWPDLVSPCISQLSSTPCIEVSDTMQAMASSKLTAEITLISWDFNSSTSAWALRPRAVCRYARSSSITSTLLNTGLLSVLIISFSPYLNA
jgi:hypothetical protein